MVFFVLSRHLGRTVEISFILDPDQEKKTVTVCSSLHSDLTLPEQVCWIGFNTLFVFGYCQYCVCSQEQAL